MEPTILHALALRRARQTLLQTHALHAVRHILACNPSGLSAPDIFAHAQHLRVLFPRVVFNPSSKTSLSQALRLRRSEDDAPWPSETLAAAQSLVTFSNSFTDDLTRPRSKANAESAVIPSPTSTELIVPSPSPWSYTHAKLSQVRWWFLSTAPAQYTRFRSVPEPLPDTTLLEEEQVILPSMSYLRTTILPILRNDRVIRSQRIVSDKSEDVHVLNPFKQSKKKANMATYVWRLIMRPRGTPKPGSPQHKMAKLAGDEKYQNKLKQRADQAVLDSIDHLNRRRMKKRLSVIYEGVSQKDIPRVKGDKR